MARLGRCMLLHELGSKSSKVAGPKHVDAVDTSKGRGQLDVVSSEDNNIFVTIPDGIPPEAAQQFETSLIHAVLAGSL